MKQRIDWIDWGKALAIFLMVLLHVHCNPTLDSFISGCRLPFFFIISGFLFSYENNPNGKDFVNKRFRQLVVPYLWINLLAYFLWLIVLRNYGENTMDQISWHTPLIGIFTGVGPLLIHDIPTWSLLSFFIVEIIFYFLVRFGFKWWYVTLLATLVFSILVSWIPEYIGHFPLVIGPSIAGLIFYSLGYGIRNSWLSNYLILNGTDNYNKIFIIVFILALLIYVPSVYFNGTISFYTCKVGNIPYFFLSSLSGACLVITFFLLLTRYIPSNPIIKIMSVGTLIICGFHLLVFAFIKGIALFIFNIDPSYFSSGLAIGLMFAIIATALTLPVIWFIRKYLRFLVDK